VTMSLSSEPHNAPDPSFTFAFQPIVDMKAREVLSYEALVRGSGNQPAYQILEQVPAERMHLFDEKLRTEAIDLATQLGIGCDLNLNLLPRSLYSSPTAILSTMEAANRHHLPITRIVLEVTEGEIIADMTHFASLINEYRGLGLKVAIDEFGAGYSGLNLLVNFQPDQIKLDMFLVRGIEAHGPVRLSSALSTRPAAILG
jgi:blue light- and temperature-responsive anti-repressor